MTQIRTGSSCRISINSTSLRGTYVTTFNPNSGLPTTGSGSNGSIRKGDFWDASASGTISGLNITDLEIGDLLIAKINGASLANQFIVNKAEGSSGTGDVVGPSSATDSAIVLFDGTTGKLIKDSTKVLTTVGGNFTALTNPSAVTWVRINADNTLTTLSADDTLNAILPSQTGNSGKFLTTNGTNSSWATVSAGATYTFSNGLTETGGAVKLGGSLTQTTTIAAGTNPLIFTSGVTTGTGATAGFQQAYDSLTTGKGLDISTSSVTSGSAISISSTSTAINYTAGTNALFSSRISGANANASRVAIAGEFVATNTGTTSTNIALYLSASGASTNYAIQAATGNVILNSTSGTTSIGTTGTSGKLTVVTAADTYSYHASDGTRTVGIYHSSSATAAVQIGTITNHSFGIFTNNGTQTLIVTATGNVGIGTGSSTVTAKLHVKGNGTTTGYNIKTENSSGTERFGVLDNGTVLFSGAAGTSGQWLKSAGSAAPPTWSDLGTINVVSPTAPNRTITMVIGGTTVYVHAKTTND